MKADHAEIRRRVIMLESCASAFVASTAGAMDQPISEEQGERYLSCKSALEASALAYAAALGVPGAAEHAELETLRRFYNGIVSLRVELTACADPNLVKETIDALLAMSFPLPMERV